MLNFFRGLIPAPKQQEYTILARYRQGYWMRQFEVTARDPYLACRAFDQSRDSDTWTRVSGATLKNPLL